MTFINFWIFISKTLQEGGIERGSVLYVVRGVVCCGLLVVVVYVFVLLIHLVVDIPVLI